MWPDFDETAFALALQEFHARKRRFGAVPPMVVPAAASGAAPDDHFQLRSSTPFSIRRNYTQQQSTRRPRLDSLFTSMTQPDHLRRIRFWLAIFITGLVLSGITAFPLQSELGWLVSILNSAALQPMAKSIHLLPLDRTSQRGGACHEHSVPLPGVWHGLAGFCSSGYRDCVRWPLYRSCQKQVGHHVRSDRLRRSHSFSP